MSSSCGLVTQNSGFQFRPTIRGIGGFAGGGAGDEQNVAIYIDNVYQSQPGANSFNLMNIERIEVLKGPQGTLFGRNATGGAIRIVTSDPKFDPSFRGFGSYGSELNSREFGGYAEAGLGSKVAASLNGYYYEDDGYVRNINPAWTEDKLARLYTYDIRPKVLFQFSEDFKAIIGGQYGYSRSSQELSTAPVDGLLAFRNVVGTILPTEPRTVSLDFEGNQISKSRTAFATLSYEAESFGLESTTAYREITTTFLFDVDRTNLPLSISFGGGPQEIFTQEFIAKTKFDGPVNLVGGAFYFDSEAHSPSAGLQSAPLSPVVGGVRTVLGAPVVTSNTRGQVDTESYAVFGEATFEVGPKVTLIGGLRYTDETKKADIRNLLQPALAPAIETLGYDNTSYRLTGRYKYRDSGMVYLTRSTGFKSGQFNATVRTVPLGKVRPEELKAWEIGLKDRVTDWLDVSLAVFDYKYDDIQLTVFNTFNPALGTNILLNAANARTQGADLQLDAQPSSSTHLSFGAAYLPKAEYSRFPNAIDYIPRADLLGATQLVTDLSGARMPYSPEWTLNLGAGVSFGAFGGTLALDGNAYYKSSFEWIPGDRFGQPRQLILNATTNWTTLDERFTVGIYGRNLTDREYMTSGGATTAGFSGAWARPREVGVKLGFNFN